MEHKNMLSVKMCQPPHLCELPIAVAVQLRADTECVLDRVSHIVVAVTLGIRRYDALVAQCSLQEKGSVGGQIRGVVRLGIRRYDALSSQCNAPNENIGGQKTAKAWWCLSDGTRGESHHA